MHRIPTSDSFDKEFLLSHFQRLAAFRQIAQMPLGNQPESKARVSLNPVPTCFAKPAAPIWIDYAGPKVQARRASEWTWACWCADRSLACASCLYWRQTI